MRRSAGLQIAASALGASALLIPAGVTPPTGHDLAVLSFPSNYMKNLTVRAHCSSCAFSSTNTGENVDSVENGGDDQFWIQGGDKSLVMKLSVSEDGEKLQLNGETIYPLHLSEGEASPHIHVPQVSSSLSIQEIEAGDVKGTPLEVTGSVVKVSELSSWSNGDSDIRLTYRIVELERLAMTVDDVSIRMLKTSKGEILIQSVFVGQALPLSEPVKAVFPISQHAEMTEMEDAMDDMPLPPPPFFTPKECNMLPGPLCRLKALVESRIMEIKQGDFPGCTGRTHPGQDIHHGQSSGLTRPHFSHPSADDESESGYVRPHHVRPHDFHHHPHHRPHRHHFVHAFARGVAAVLIPTLAGVAVGMAVSLFGLFVGRIISFVWISLVRGGRRGYARVSLEEGDLDKGLILDEEIEPLPLYEDAPAYEEAIAEPK